MNSMTSHPIEREELMAFLDGQPCGDTRGLAAHLESCEECRAVAEELRAGWAALRAWSVETPSKRIELQVLAAGSGSGAERLSHPRKMPWKRWALPCLPGYCCG